MKIVDHIIIHFSLSNSLFRASISISISSPVFWVWIFTGHLPLWWKRCRQRLGWRFWFPCPRCVRSSRRSREVGTSACWQCHDFYRTNCTNSFLRGRGNQTRRTCTQSLVVGTRSCNGRHILDEWFLRIRRCCCLWCSDVQFCGSLGSTAIWMVPASMALPWVRPSQEPSQAQLWLPPPLPFRDELR